MREEKPSPRDELKSQSLHCEIYMPHEIAAGIHTGQSHACAGGNKTLTLKVSLEVWNFTLPDQTELHARDELLRLAGERAGLLSARSAASHGAAIGFPIIKSGRVSDGCAPRVGWTANSIGRRGIGGLDNISTARRSPTSRGETCRSRVVLFAAQRKLADADGGELQRRLLGRSGVSRLVSPAVRRRLAGDCAEHVNEKHWDDTFFQCFFNGKNDFKSRGWSRGSLAMAARRAGPLSRLLGLAVFRNRVSRRSGSRARRCQDCLPLRYFATRVATATHWTDCWITTWSAGRCGNTIGCVMDREEATGQVVIEYGGRERHRGIERPAGRLVRGCLDPGLRRRVAVANDRQRRIVAQGGFARAVYPGREGDELPIPSVRLKAFRRGQQDVEYLAMLARSRPAHRAGTWREFVRKALKVEGRKRGSGFTRRRRCRRD